MKNLKELTGDAGSIREQVLNDADGEVSYISDIANHGCFGGSCSGLIYYVDTHAFTAKHMDEINEIINEIRDRDGSNVLNNEQALGDVFNYLAWLAYEVRAQEIMQELEGEEV